MAEMLLINPRSRRKSAAKRKTTKRRVTRKTTAASLSAVRRRRRNPIAAVARRRRRNPIGGMMKNSKIGNMLKDALIGGAGSVAVDFAMGQINSYLPTGMKKMPGSVGVYDALKAAVTVALGQALSKSTKGLSQKAAQGALTVQVADILKTFVPGELRGGLGYSMPSRIVQGVNRVGPIARPGISAYTRPGSTALLSAYTKPGASALLNGSRNASIRSREGFTIR